MLYTNSFTRNFLDLSFNTDVRSVVGCFTPTIMDMESQQSQFTLVHKTL